MTLVHFCGVLKLSFDYQYPRTSEGQASVRPWINCTINYTGVPLHIGSFLFTGKILVSGPQGRLRKVNHKGQLYCGERGVPYVTLTPNGISANGDQVFAPHKEQWVLTRLCVLGN